MLAALLPTPRPKEQFHKRAATLLAARARPESLQGESLKCSPSKMQGRKDALTP
jgi:hypothetical protein